MIPVLFEHDATSFTSFGIGALKDTVSCEVTEERNGKYELVLKYPITGQLYSEILKERIIRALVNDNKSVQAFRIYRITAPISGIVTIYAQHISYDLSGVVVFPCKFDGSNPSQILNFICQRRLDRAINFTLTSDIANTGALSVDTPRTLRSVLGGEKESLVSNFGGELEWDNFNVYLRANRGRDNGVSILYGKNLTKLEHNSDLSNVYTHLCPYAKVKNGDVEHYQELTEKVLPIVTTLSEKKVLIMDFSSCFGTGADDLPLTEANLRSVAQNYLIENVLGIENPNITLSFEELRNQLGYSNLHETVKLCDTVTVKYPELGANIKTKIVKVIYDSLKEKYKSLTLGAIQTSLNDKISSIETGLNKTNEEVRDVPSRIQEAVDHATDMITGASGGCVVLDLDSQNRPYELLIMDDYSKDDATKVWRWNINGLGYSPNGYNGPYTTAITADGHIVADFIDTGTLTASVIHAGTISSNDGQSYWNLETGDINLTGEINATSGYISNFQINSDGISTGPTSINDHAHAGLYLANGGINFTSGVSNIGYSTVMVKPYGSINGVGMGPHLHGEKYSSSAYSTQKNNFILASNVLSLKSYTKDNSDYGGFLTYRTKIYNNDASQDYVSTFVYPSIESDDELVAIGKETGTASYTISVGHIWDNYGGYVPDVSIEMVTYGINASRNHGELFGTWRSYSAIVVTSDKNKKKDIEVLDERYSTFFNHLNPVRFKYKGGTSSRYHTGFIAQEIVEALEQSNLSEKELAAICTIENQDKTSELGIRYEELIALCVKEIQALSKRVRELEEKK